MHKKNLTTKEIFALAVQKQKKNNFKIAENFYKQVNKLSCDTENDHVIVSVVTLNKALSPKLLGQISSKSPSSLYKTSAKISAKYGYFC